MQRSLCLALLALLFSSGAAVAEPASRKSEGVLRGKLRVPASTPRPASLRIRFQRPAKKEGQVQGKALPSKDQSCVLEGSSFHCTLPAEKLDLALVAPGFAPVYFWGIDVDRGGVRDVGTLRLAAGASVAGWVVAPVPHESPAVLEVAPETTGWVSDPRARRGRLLSSEGRADERGFFQLSGLGAGSFRLLAHRKDGARAERAIELLEGRDLVLSEPLTLALPINLEAFVQPAEVGGKPLFCVAERIAPRSNVVEEVARKPIALDGSCSLGGLQRGIYTVRVLSLEGSTYYVSEVDVEPGISPLSVALDLVEVEGIVTFGKSVPVVGEVVFGTLHRQPNVSVATDDDGRFTTVLPRDGEWPVDVVEDGTTHTAPGVEVERRSDGKPTSLHIALPSALVRGRVLEKGEPVADAIVFAVRRDENGKESREAFTRSREDGTFFLRGVREGSLVLKAYTRTSASRWTPLDVSRDQEVKGVELPLSRQIEFALRVVGPRGPIVGAYVQAFPILRGTRERWAHRGTTDADGSIAWTDVDADAESMDVFVVAAGYGVRLLRVPMAYGAASPLVLTLGESRGSLVLRRGALAGRTLRAEGAEVPLSAVLPTFFQVGLAIEGESGLTLADLSPGSYTLCAESSGDCSTGELRPNEALALGSSSTPQEGPP